MQENPNEETGQDPGDENLPEDEQRPLKDSQKYCELCDSPMFKASKVLIKDTYYYIWKCKKCKHEVARSED